MRSRLGLIPLALIFGCARPPGPVPVAPESITGVWEGMLTSGSDAHAIRLTLETDSTGYRGFVDLPDQYAHRYALRNLVVEGGAVSFEFPDALPPASFNGTFDGGRIYGTFTTPPAGDSATGTFELSRWAGESVPYRVESVGFVSGGVPLRGTLFVPNSTGPHPAVVLLHGSGPQTRESYIRYFADQFARSGFTALIYDKRNATRTDTSVRRGATFDELADDATAAVRYLRALPDAVDPRRIGLWGLSQGAWIAPMAAERIEGIAFLVLVSGGGTAPAREELRDRDADAKYDPVPLLERLRLPVLVVLGERDRLTPVDETARTMNAALRKARNPDFAIREISGADHVLMVRGRGDSWLEHRPASGWVDEMIAWMVARARRR